MTHPSSRSILDGFSRTFMRFPVAILLAIAAAVMYLRLIFRSYEKEQIFVNAIAAAYLGMMLSIALTALAGRRSLGRLPAMMAQAVAIALAVFYYLLLPDHYTVQALIFLRLYFGLLLAIWLLLTVFYFAVFRRATLRWIPVSLCVVVFLSSFGAWGAFGVSLHSQLGQLKQVLTKNRLLVDGKITKASTAVPVEDITKISGIISDVVEVYGYHALQPLYREDLDRLIAGAHKEGYVNVYSINRERAGILVKAMDIRFATGYGLEDYGDAFFVRSYSDDADPMYISGYDYMVEKLFIRSPDSAGASFQLGDNRWLVRLDSGTNRMTLSLRGYPLVVDLDTVLRAAPDLDRERSLQLPVAKMTLDADNGEWSCRLLPNGLEGRCGA